MIRSRLIFCALIFAGIAALIASCKKDLPFGGSSNGWVYNPHPVAVPVPFSELHLPPSATPADNPQTLEGIKLGRMLFYDPILSGDSTQACASCHKQQYAFSDGGNRYSKGITGQLGTRNAPPLFNLVYSQKYFWDGRAASLEEQAQKPVANPIEMNSQWTDVIAKLQRSKRYPQLFYEAFGIQADSIKPLVVAKAIAQFLRTIVSNNSPFDKAQHGGFLSDAASNGAVDIETNQVGDCGHCHGDYLSNRSFMELSASGQFRNDGLQNVTTQGDFSLPGNDPGLGGITGVYQDYGKFKVPTLRNLVFTGPYMHDGRFATIEEVVDFYSTSVHGTPFTDPSMTKPGGTLVLNLSADRKAEIVAFLQALTDSSLITNPDYSNPFQ